MTLIERLLAQANKESNELADLLNEAAEAIQPASKEEPLGTYESITDIMLQLRSGTIEQQQVYEMVKNQPIYASQPVRAKQKPMAVVLQRHVKVGSNGRLHTKRYISPLNNGKIEMSPDLNVGDYLYQSTAKKQWIGLTDDELLGIIAQVDKRESYIQAALHRLSIAIESKLKEKNA